MSLGLFFLLQVVVLAGTLVIWSVSRRRRGAVAPHVHDWLPWESTMIEIINVTSGRKMYSVSGQRRRCKTCGFKEVKKVR